MPIRISLVSVLVDDQDKALSFYTEKLGFRVNHDIPVGEFRWLTVVPPGGVEGVELFLEPNQHPAAVTYQQALFADGLPATTFFVDDLDSEFHTLSERGVVFTSPPADAGGVKVATLDDTCGNLIQLTQQPA